MGDVMGHGMRSAARMGQLRAIVATLALEGHAPGALLRRLAGSVDVLLDLELATLLVAAYDPAAGTLTVASAGPPAAAAPPAHGVAAFLDVEPGPPIGRPPVRLRRDRRAAAARRHRGPLHRRPGGEPRASRWTSAWSGCGRALEEIAAAARVRSADHVLARAGRVGGGDDDVALLVLLTDDPDDQEAGMSGMVLPAGRWRVLARLPRDGRRARGGAPGPVVVTALAGAPGREYDTAGATACSTTARSGRRTWSSRPRCARRRPRRRWRRCDRPAAGAARRLARAAARGAHDDRRWAGSCATCWPPAAR